MTVDGCAFSGLFALFSHLSYKLFTGRYYSKCLSKPENMQIQRKNSGQTCENGASKHCVNASV